MKIEFSIYNFKANTISTKTHVLLFHLIEYSITKVFFKKLQNV